MRFSLFSPYVSFFHKLVAPIQSLPSNETLSGWLKTVPTCLIYSHWLIYGLEMEHSKCCIILQGGKAHRDSIIKYYQDRTTTYRLLQDSLCKKGCISTWWKRINQPPPAKAKHWLKVNIACSYDSHVSHSIYWNKLLQATPCRARGKKSGNRSASRDQNNEPTWNSNIHMTQVFCSSRRFSKHFPNQVFMGFASKLQLTESQHSEVPGRSLSTSRQKRSTKLRQKLAAMAKFCPIASNIRLITVAVGTTKSASPRACHHCKGNARNSDKTTTYSGLKHTSY